VSDDNEMTIAKQHKNNIYQCNKNSTDQSQKSDDKLLDCNLM